MALRSISKPKMLSLMSKHMIWIISCQPDCFFHLFPNIYRWKVRVLDFVRFHALSVGRLLPRPVDRGSKGSQIDGAPKLWGPPEGLGRGPSESPKRGASERVTERPRKGSFRGPWRGLSGALQWSEEVPRGLREALGWPLGYRALGGPRRARGAPGEACQNKWNF